MMRIVLALSIAGLAAAVGGGTWAGFGLIAEPCTEVERLRLVAFLAVLLVPVFSGLLFFLLGRRRRDAEASAAAPDELEALTVQEPGLDEVLEAFERLDRDLAGNLKVMESFRRHLADAWRKRDVEYRDELEDRAVLAEASRLDRETAGRYEILKQILRAFAPGIEPAGLLDLLIRMAARLTGSARASVMLVDKSGGSLYLHKTLGWTADPAETGSRVPLGEGFAGLVARDNKRMLVTDIEAETGRGNRPGYASKSFVILPIGAGPRVVGVLNLTEKPEGDIYTLDDLELLNLLLAAASLALDNALLRKASIGEGR